MLLYRLYLTYVNLNVAVNEILNQFDNFDLNLKKKKKFFIYRKYIYQQQQQQRKRNLTSTKIKFYLVRAKNFLNELIDLNF